MQKGEKSDFTCTRHNLNALFPSPLLSFDNSVDYNLQKIQLF